jgi:hypothetical protein
MFSGDDPQLWHFRC